MSGEFFLPAFRFNVWLTRSPNPRASGIDPGPVILASAGAFAECSGLELESDVKEYLEGGRNDGVIRRVGRVKLSPIVLKRGMFSADDRTRADSELWQWINRMVTGVLPVTRYDGRIEILAPKDTLPLATWTFVRGLPQKVTGPTLNAKTGEIAVEELHIVHEGLRMEVPQ